MHTAMHETKTKKHRETDRQTEISPGTDSDPKKRKAHTANT